MSGVLGGGKTRRSFRERERPGSSAGGGELGESVRLAGKRHGVWCRLVHGHGHGHEQEGCEHGKM